MPEFTATSTPHYFILGKSEEDHKLKQQGISTSHLFI